MVLLDNSLFARNGDAIPSRFQVELEGATSVINFKTNDNPETSVGLMLMAGKGKQILTTPTNDSAQLLAQYSKIPIQDYLGLCRSIQIARLTMKHRVNKHQHERLVIFIASAIKDNPEDLYVLARNLRRDNIAVDLVNICCPENLQLLQNFHEIVNVENESRLVNYAGGATRLNDALKEGGVLGGHFATDGGFGDDMDPQMEMVIRMSLEEERKRQEEMERQRATEANQGDQGMVLEETENDDEKTALLDQANRIVKESEGDKGNGELAKDPKLIEDILKELNLKKKDEDPSK
jgi:26S proteasome regulatory subunit N10